MWSSVNSGCGTGFCVKLPDVKVLNDKEYQNMVETVTSTEVNDTVTPKLAARVISPIPGVSMDGKLTDMIVTENVNRDSDATARVISAPGELLRVRQRWVTPH